jgi:hypothetical protein
MAPSTCQRDTAILIQAFQAEGARLLRVDDDAKVAVEVTASPPDDGDALGW